MASNTQVHEGGCTCRQVRYRMTSKPLFVHCCHCRWCQRETGAAFALNAMIEADRVELLAGEPEMVADAVGERQGPEDLALPEVPHRGVEQLPGRRRRRALRARRHARQSRRLPPDIHIFTMSKQPWVVLPEGTPAVPEFYDIKKMWPAESQERRKAMRRG